MPKVSNQLKSLRSILRKQTDFVQLETAGLVGTKGKGKHVKWDPETIDNEYKFKSRSKATVLVKKTTTAVSILAAQQGPAPRKTDSLGQYLRSPSQGSLKYRAPSPHPVSVTSRSTIILPTASRPREASSSQQPERTHKDTTREQISKARPITKTTSTRDPRSVMPTQVPKPDQLNNKRNFMNMSDHVKTTESSGEVRVAANTRAKRDLKVAAQQKIETKPTYRPRAPVVPDPPRWSQKPPPAPRPARLPTPDLPEIEGNYFHDLDPFFNNMVGTSAWYTNEYMYETKMNVQLQDARAHIEGMKKFRKM